MTLGLVYILVLFFCMVAGYTVTFPDCSACCGVPNPCCPDDPTPTSLLLTITGGPSFILTYYADVRAAQIAGGWACALSSPGQAGWYGSTGTAHFLMLPCIGSDLYDSTLCCSDATPTFETATLVGVDCAPFHAAGGITTSGLDCLGGGVAGNYPIDVTGP